MCPPRKWLGLISLLLFTFAAAPAFGAATIEDRYSGLSTGFLKSAVLAPLDDNTLLTSDDNLRKDYPEKLNVVFVHVGEEQILSSRFGIRSIPVQVFFDAKGSKAFRHVGFFKKKDVIEQLKKMGVQK